MQASGHLVHMPGKWPWYTCWMQLQSLSTFIGAPFLTTSSQHLHGSAVCASKQSECFHHVYAESSISHLSGLTFIVAEPCCFDEVFLKSKALTCCPRSQFAASGATVTPVMTAPAHAMKHIYICTVTLQYVPFIGMPTQSMHLYISSTSSDSL